MTIVNKGFIEDLRSRGPEIAAKINGLLKTDKDHYSVLLYAAQSSILPVNELSKLWADHLNIAWIDLKSTLFQPDVVEKLSKDLAVELVAIPVYQMGEVVTIAMMDPKNMQQVAKIEDKLKARVSPLFALKDEILDAIEVQYHTVTELEGLTDSLALVSAHAGKEISRAELEKSSGKQAVIDFVNGLLLLAVKEDASDIHIESFEDHLLVRFRIDGVLIKRLSLATDIAAPLLSRLKIMAKMDITERRRPQDGRISMALRTKAIGLRLSTVPTVYGEKAVLRVLGQIQKKNIPLLESLNFSKSIYDWAKKLINAPSGSFFITGPTGCGKTTTLFSSLQKINTPDKNIMTIEDPVEYRLPGINQVQVESEIGVTFPNVLRAFLRQDPDVMLIGEIRDLETAKIATEAALTGHLVFATLHTNDALQAVTRLVEIGVDPFLVGPSLIGVMAQRLVRRLCDHCKQGYEVSREKMDHLFEWDGKQPLTFFRSVGCSRCRHTGYNGRIGIHEMIMVDEPLRRLITSNAPPEELRAAALLGGYQSMHYDGLKKVIRGLTSLEEVDRVAPLF
ncbi:MAG: GspE/PulE family protein [Desulfobulbaceae bacterium]|nr:GspE/PulE family protein [Desulfobulbaceae bacterium]